MNIIEAFKTGLPVRRIGKATWYYATDNAVGAMNTGVGTFVNCDYLLQMSRVTREDILAEDWEVKEEKIEITEAQLNIVLEEYNHIKNTLVAKPVWTLLKEIIKCG